MDKYAEIRGQLNEQLDRLQSRLGKVNRDLQQPGSKDSQELATDRENDEVLEGLDEHGRAEIQQIQAALARLDAGSYGRCESCEEEIPLKRLEAVPHTTRCAPCAS